MGEETGISWTDATFNPWWGCWKIADECKNCYADSTAHRYASQFGELWGRTAARRFFGEAHWNEPRKWNAKAKRDGVRRRVFVGSMCDWAENHPDPELRAKMDAERVRLFALIRECDGLDWLLLTKRIAEAREHLPWMSAGSETWRNVWVGVTAGTRKALAENAPILKSIRAAQLFISCEPFLEDIPAGEWDRALRGAYRCVECESRYVDHDGTCATCGADSEPSWPVDWLIVGDESGSARRAAQPDWIRGAREAAIRNRVAFHFKQWCGANIAGISGPEGDARKPGRKIHLPMLDGRQWAEFPQPGKVE